MGKHSKPVDGQAMADAFDAQYAESQANYVAPTLQEKVDAYNAVRQENADLREQNND